MRPEPARTLVTFASHAPPFMANVYSYGAPLQASSGCTTIVARPVAGSQCADDVGRPKMSAHEVVLGGARATLLMTSVELAQSLIVIVALVTLRLEHSESAQ